MRFAPTPFRLWILASGAAAALACAAQPAAAAVALNGEMNAVANVYADGHPTVTSTDHQAWSGAPGTLNTSVFAQASGGVYHDHNETMAAFGTAQGTWGSANSGSVDFTDYGWNWNVKNPTQPSGADLDANRPGNGADWSYSFKATGDGTFTMDYNVTGFGTTNGLYGWAIFFSGGGAGGPDINNLSNDPTTSGVFSAAIHKGSTYDVALYGNPNGAGYGPQQFSGSMNGQFDWNIAERGGAPEPASWALMLVGFGGLGAMLRRRRCAVLA